MRVDIFVLCVLERGGTIFDSFSHSPSFVIKPYPYTVEHSLFVPQAFRSFPNPWKMLCWICNEKKDAPISSSSKIDASVVQGYSLRSKKDNKSVKKTSNQRNKTEQFTQLIKPHLRTLFNAREYMENSAC